MDRTTGKVEVTAHNHGFAVDAPLDAPTQTPYGVATVSHVCLNDDVVEGLELRDADGALTSFSVQYHPEAAAGPHDAAYLFDRFCADGGLPVSAVVPVGARSRRCRPVCAVVEMCLRPRSVARHGPATGPETHLNLPHHRPAALGGLAEAGELTPGGLG